MGDILIVYVRCIAFLTCDLNHWYIALLCVIHALACIENTVREREYVSVCPSRFYYSDCHNQGYFCGTIITRRTTVTSDQINLVQYWHKTSMFLGYKSETQTNVV